MNTPPRKIVINILPQSAAAWEAITTIAFFVAWAVIFSGFSTCAARSAEAEAHAKAHVKISDNTIISTK